MKIDSCLIVRNESNNIENLITQLSIFSNNIYIVDTGSEDDTLQKLYNIEHVNKKVHTYSMTWWGDYSLARNYAFSKSTNADYIFVCDGNDELNEHLVNDLIEFRKKKFSNSLPDIIDIEKHLEGRFKTVPMLIKRKKHLKWVGYFNEFLLKDKNTTEQKYFLNISQIINHGSNNNGVKYNAINYAEYMGQFFTVQDLLTKAVNCQDTGEHITAFLIFKEIFYNKNYRKNERFDALMYAFWSYYYAKDQYDMDKGIEDMMNYFIKQNWENKRVFLHFADFYYTHERWDEALKYYELAFNRDESKDVITYFHNEPIGTVWICSQLVLLYVNHFNNLKKAKVFNDIILSIIPDDEGALYNEQNIFNKVEE